MATFQSNISQQNIDFTQNTVVAKSTYNEDSKAFIRELNEVLVA